MKDLPDDPTASRMLLGAHKFVRLPLQNKRPILNSGLGHCGFACVSQALLGTEELIFELRLRSAVYLISKWQEVLHVAQIHDWHGSATGLSLEEEINACLNGWANPYSFYAMSKVLQCPIYIWQPKVVDGEIVQFCQARSATFNPEAPIKRGIDILRTNSDGYVFSFDHYCLLVNKAPTVVEIP